MLLGICFGCLESRYLRGWRTFVEQKCFVRNGLAWNIVYICIGLGLAWNVLYEVRVSLECAVRVRVSLECGV